MKEGYLGYVRIQPLIVSICFDALVPTMNNKNKVQGSTEKIYVYWEHRIDLY